MAAWFARRLVLPQNGARRGLARRDDRADSIPAEEDDAMNRTRLIRAAALLALVSTAAGATAAEGDESLYPSELRQQRPAVAAQYQAMIEPVADEHGWVEDGGTETPISRITLDGSEYVVLSGCKPHDCSAESLVTLLRPGGDVAVGALAVNRGDAGFGPKRSTLTWLGEPDRAERRFIAAYLFR